MGATREPRRYFAVVPCFQSRVLLGVSGVVMVWLQGGPDGGKKKETCRIQRRRKKSSDGNLFRHVPSFCILTSAFPRATSNPSERLGSGGRRIQKSLLQASFHGVAVQGTGARPGLAGGWRRKYNKKAGVSLRPFCHILH